MAKRERKAWAIISPRGAIVGVEWKRVDIGFYFYPAEGDRVVRCAITWDDGKPEKAKRKAKRALQEP